MSESILVKTSLKEIEGESIASIQKDMQRMYEIWDELEFVSDYKCEKATFIWGYMKDLMKKLCKTEKAVYEDIKDRVTNNKNKVIELSNILEVPIKEPQGSLLDIEKMLKMELESLIKLKSKREMKYQKLKVEESKYCQLLKLPESFLPEHQVPSEKDISDLRLRVGILKEEQNFRQEKMSLLKAEFVNLIEETSDIASKAEFEKEVLPNMLDESVSDEAFDIFEGMIHQAQKKKKEMENEKKNLVDRLNILWKMLKVDESKRIEFLSKHNGCRPSTISSIEQELERCIAIKKENMGSLVNELRVELLQLWDLCEVPSTERDKFHYFSATELSDEVLEAHEGEVEKWKKYQAKADLILKKIEKRQQLWEMMVVFENKASDPSRFKNRGGNLLKEEKQRKKVQKDLPALEEEIFRDIDSLKEKDGLDFFYRREDFKTYVANQWSEMFPQKDNKKPLKPQISSNNDSTPSKASIQKEIVKTEKQQTNSLQTDNDSTLKTPAKKPLKTIPKTAPSKLLKPSVISALPNTPTASKSKVMPAGCRKVSTTDAKLFPAKSNVVQIEDKNMR
ncbi:hypothetical protein JTE90_023092 [Oedothorax gibbosus]|uniref:Protein regulator of cytokinesis 1 n=1 Tax=Oedothorax gibbosus TaxID=931172 RepID=A0AAV6UXA1_9ARAC|nr:hypothetical protein JTE90_023092 [Oedothorax gibbosus]